VTSRSHWAIYNYITVLISSYRVFPIFNGDVNFIYFVKEQDKNPGLIDTSKKRTKSTKNNAKT